MLWKGGEEVCRALFSNVPTLKAGHRKLRLI